MARRVVDEEPATHIGNDEPEFDGDVEVAIEDDEDGGRRAYFVPRPLRNAGPEERSMMYEIQARVRLNMRALEDLAELVDQAHYELGFSWNSIGWLTGMSGRGAQKRWGRQSPTS